jgi:hypothetical protein
LGLELGKVILVSVKVLQRCNKALTLPL